MKLMKIFEDASIEANHTRFKQELKKIMNRYNVQKYKTYFLDYQRSYRIKIEKNLYDWDGIISSIKQLNGVKNVTKNIELDYIELMVSMDVQQFARQNYIPLDQMLR